MIPGLSLYTKCLSKENFAKQTLTNRNSDSNDDPNANAKAIQREMKADPWASEQMKTIIIRGKICAVCGVSEYGSDYDWKCCSKCDNGWCCSPEHWKKYKRKHTPAVCDSYKQLTSMELFHWNHVKTFGDALTNFPESTLPQVRRTFYNDWEEYMVDRFGPKYVMGHHQGRVPPELFPCSTRILSQAVTALYGMYEHGIEAFENLDTLTIHIVGANSQFEYPPTCVWEEMMHCLPNIQTLTSVLIGPEADDAGRDMMSDVACCPTCQVNNRTRIMGVYSTTYHDHFKKFKAVPDFIVAYNTGLYDECTESWKESIKVMLDMNVPCFFTSFDGNEASADVEVVKSIGGKMLYKEGARENPFKDMTPRYDPSGVDKFYHNNFYCYGFKGYDS